MNKRKMNIKYFIILLFYQFFLYFLFQEGYGQKKHIVNNSWSSSLKNVNFRRYILGAYRRYIQIIFLYISSC